MAIINAPLYGQGITFEQAALDYYTQVIHPKECAKKEKYFLEESLNLRKSDFLYGVCFKDYLKIQKVEKIELKPDETGLVVTSTFFSSLNSRRKKRGTTIFVNQANASPQNTIFVEISFINQRTGKHYYIELTTQKEPIRWCKKEVIF